MASSRVRWSAWKFKAPAFHPVAQPRLVNGEVAVEGCVGFKWEALKSVEM